MYPCDDELFVDSLGETEMSNHDHNGHQHEDGADFCSPFCVCAVTNVVEFEQFIVAENDTKEFQNPTFIYIAPFSKESTSKVFQPPQA